MAGDTLIVIPARGGSKGIPRKNLRLLAGRPLIAYAVSIALESRQRPVVCVSSDDEEILALAAKLGVLPHRRPAALANDACTLDPVVFDALVAVAKATGKSFDLVVTLQPTSPLLKAATLQRAIQQMRDNPETDSLISACEDTHLTWRQEGERFVPNYAQRLNRQLLPRTFRETGAFLLTRASLVTPTGRIGPRPGLFLLSGGEAIDIDTYEDWSLCELILKRKTVLFVVAGYNEIGLGHVYRSLLLAGGILNHRVRFLVDRKSQLAFEKISQHNYEVHMQHTEDLVESISALSPDVVINDILDTEEGYVTALKERGLTVINFEDLGGGAEYADLVVNALYSEKAVLPNHHFGHAYFCARDEFIYSGSGEIRPRVARVLLTFGGVDPNNLTRKVLAAIYDYCQAQEINISVVLGMGYRQEETLAGFPGIQARRDVRNISDDMLGADVAFTSAGRTVYELACIGTPTIVLAQNAREMTHLFATAENGFVNLGLGEHVAASDIFAALRALVENAARRQAMHDVMLSRDLRSGRERVLRLVQETIARGDKR